MPILVGCLMGKRGFIRKVVETNDGVLRDRRVIPQAGEHSVY